MTALAEKFAILKIPMILDRSKDEKDVLAKYEWSKVYGALFGCEKEASKLYESAAGAHSSDSKESTDTQESTDTKENTEFLYFFLSFSYLILRFCIRGDPKTARVLF